MNTDHERHPGAVTLDAVTLYERIRGRLTHDHQLALWTDPEVRADLIERVTDFATSEATGAARWNAADLAKKTEATFVPPPTDVADDGTAVWGTAGVVVVGLPEGADGASEPSVTIAGTRVTAQDGIDVAETIRAAVSHARLHDRHHRG